MSGTGGPGPNVAGTERRCLNCDAPLTGEFCGSCGQRVRSRNPTLREFVDDVVGDVFHWDGKFPATLKALLLKPGLLTEDFLAGRRARWLSPLRLYLICSVAYFLSGPVMERLTGYSGKAVARLELSADSTDLEDLRLLQDSAAFVNAPEIRDNPIVRAIGADKAFMLANNGVMLKDIVAEAFPRAMFVLLPFFAFLTWIAWRSSGLLFPAHVAFALHVHAAWFAALVVPKLVEPLPTLLPVRAAPAGLALIVMAQLAILAYSTWYVIVACRRALGGTTNQILVRTTLVGLVYLPFALAAVALATVLAINAL